MRLRPECPKLQGIDILEQRIRQKHQKAWLLIDHPCGRVTAVVPRDSLDPCVLTLSFAMINDSPDVAAEYVLNKTLDHGASNV